VSFSIILEGCRNIKGVGLFSVLKGLKVLPNLHTLEIAPSIISDNLMEELQQTVSKIEKLTTLNLRFGGKDKREGALSDKGFKELAKTFESLPGLEHLYLDILRGEWNITDDGIISLAAAIYKLKGLNSLRLNLRGIEFLNESGVGHLCEALTKLRKLKKLHLNFKTDNEENIFELRTALSVLIELRYLQLDFSWGVSDATVAELKEAFLNLNKLNQLHINFSGCENITDEGAQEIGEILVNLPELNDLKLELPWCYGISNDGVAIIAEAIAKIPSLSSLCLNLERGNKEDDKVTDAGINEIFMAIGEQPQLKILNLNFASCPTIIDEDIGILAEGIASLEKLTNLTLDFKLCDQIGDEGLNKLREALKDLPSLNNVLMNFLWCGKITQKGILKMLELKKEKKIPQFLIAYKKDEIPAEEGGCNIF